MSTPRPGALLAPRLSTVRRKIKHNETFDDVLADAPQIARPFLMAAVDTWDFRSIQLNNGNVVTWNGIIVDPSENPSDASAWFITEPYRRLDGTIVYGDGWERRNDGTFVAQSGLMIDKDLTLIHRNGHSIFPDGMTVAPSGRIFYSKPNSVGIIYRPGSSDAVGVVYEPRPETPYNIDLMKTIEPVSFEGQIIVPQTTVQPWEDVSRIRHNAKDVYGQVEQYPVPQPNPLPNGGPVAPDGKFIPPQMREEALNSRCTPEQEKAKKASSIRTLEPLQLIASLPDDLKPLVEICDMDGCTHDVFGIPLCVPIFKRNLLVPYAKVALKKLNDSSS